MKYILIALMLISPVAVSQELVLKSGKTYMVVTTTCKTGSTPLKVDIERVKPGKIIRIYTADGSEKCRIKTVKTLA